MSTPFTPPAWWLSGTNQNSIPANDNALRFWISQADVDNTTTSQPASPAEGQCHIIQTTHTGAQWSAFTPKDLAIFSNGTWYAFAPAEGNKVTVGGVIYVYSSGSWVAAGGGGGGSTAWDDLTDVPQPILDLGALTDPGADRLLFWDESAGVYTHLTLGTNLSIAGATLNASGGGGGLSNWTEAVSTASPNNTAHAVSLTVIASTTNADAVLSPKGTGALLAQVPNANDTGGDKRGDSATDWQRTRDTANQVASGANSTVGGGHGNRASGNWSTVPGGYTNLANGNMATASGGRSQVASGAYSVASGGFGNTASGEASWIPGGDSASTRGIRGMGAFASGSFAEAGDAQVGQYVLRRQGTDDTTIVLTADGSSPGSANGVVMRDGSVYSFRARVVARNVDAAAALEIVGCFKRGSGAGTVAMVGSIAVTSIGADAGASSWAVTAAANTTLGSIEIRATGAAGTNIKWLAHVETCEVAN